MTEILHATQALCPVCQSRLNAAYAEQAGGVYLSGDCPEHGPFATLVWRDKAGFLPWLGGIPTLSAVDNPNCPGACGLCDGHQQGTCCVVLEITERCNLECRHCFADPCQAPDPSLEQVRGWLRDFSVPGQTLVQLSGGEPTLREDLPEIVAAAKQAGCRYVQLNSNGLRLAEDENLAARLAEAGLSFVFLQFDGLDDDIYDQLRGRPLLQVKKRAIAHCSRAGLGVTLVPTLVPGISERQIGPILRFALNNSPTVRGVHFQPLSYLGRSPVEAQNAPRFTLDQLIDEVIAQSNGLIERENLLTSACDHPLCGLHGDFMVLPDGKLHALTSGQNACCCGRPGSDPAAQNRDFVGRRWQRQTSPCCCDAEQPFDITDMEQFLARVKSHGFTITAMAFQDAASLDLGRLQRCSLHVFSEGKLIPFCWYYLNKTILF